MRPLKFNVHGNGFLQVQVDPSNRIHIWHPSIPRQAVETPFHDHKFDFVSQVLAGQLLNITLGVIDSPLGNYRAYTPVVNETPNIDAKLEPVEDSLSYVVQASKVDTHNVNDTYQMRAGFFHHTVAIGPTMTRMHINARHENHRPRILVADGTEPDNSFNRLEAMSEDDVWHLIDTAFPHLSEWVHLTVAAAQIAEDEAARQS